MPAVTRTQRQQQDLMELLRTTHILLMPGVQDIAGFDTMNVSKIYDVIRRADKDGFIKVIEAGQTFDLQKRITLTNKGVHTVRQHFSLPPKQQGCAGSHVENLARLRLYEPIMRLAPRLFRSGAIATPFVYTRDPGDDPREVVLDGFTELVDIDWLESKQDSNIHAIAWFRTADGELVWVPIVTVGLHHISRRQEERDQSVPSAARINVTAGLETVPSFIHGPVPASPLGVVFIVVNRLAGLFVKRHYADVRKAIVDAEGNIITALNPQMPMGRIERPNSYSGPIGLPETELDHLLKDPKVTAMQGVTQRRVFE